MPLTLAQNPEKQDADFFPSHAVRSLWKNHPRPVAELTILLQPRGRIARVGDPSGSFPSSAFPPPISYALSHGGRQFDQYR